MVAMGYFNKQSWHNGKSVSFMRRVDLCIQKVCRVSRLFQGSSDWIMRCTVTFLEVSANPNPISTALKGFPKKAFSSSYDAQNPGSLQLRQRLGTLLPECKH